MNEEIRGMIGEALRDEPAMRVDRAAVLRAGRRRVALRRAGLSGAAALSVLAVVSAAVVVAGQRDGAPATGVGPPSGLTTPTTTTAPTTAPPPPGPACADPLVPGSAPDTPVDPARLAEAGRLTAAFAGVPIPTSAAPPTATFCAFAEGWRTDFLPIGARSLMIEVRARGGASPSGCNTAGGAMSCRTVTVPEAEVRITISPGGDLTQPNVVDVLAWRADGTTVALLETGTIGTDGSPAAPRALTDDQLVDLATAPQLRTEWTGSVAHRLKEATDARAAEFSAVVADGSWLPAGMRAVPVPDARVGALEFVVSQGGYKLMADLVDAAGEGHLFVNLDENGGGQGPTCAGLDACTEITLPDGGRATVQEQVQGKERLLMLNTLRPSGVQVVLMTGNVSDRVRPREKNAPPPEPTRATPSLDLAALQRIAVLF